MSTTQIHPPERHEAVCMSLSDTGLGGSDNDIVLGSSVQTANPTPHPLADTVGAEVARFLGLPFDTDGDNAASLHYACRRLRAGQRVCFAGQAFSALYLVRWGHFKAVGHDLDGHARVFAFFMKGELAGLDGLAESHYAYDLVALGDAEVIVLPFATLARLTRCHVQAEMTLYRQLSLYGLNKDLCAEWRGLPRAQDRVGAFIDWQAKRFGRMGYSEREFILPMSRRDIGGFLGLSLETVSRAVSHLRAARIIDVRRRNLRILEPHKLIHDSGRTTSVSAPVRTSTVYSMVSNLPCSAPTFLGNTSSSTPL